MPGTDGDEPVSEHLEDEPAEEELQEEPMNLQIGDIVFICRNQIIATGGRTDISHSFKLVDETDPEKMMGRFTLIAEGIADNKVSGIVADDWLQNPQMCLFRIETPSTISSASLSPAQLKLETRANKESFRKSQGVVIKYGQEVQLRHVHSDRFLSLDLLAAANAPGAWSVTVNEPNGGLCRQISLLPFNRSHNIGDPIRYGEVMSMVFQTENLKYFVQSEVISPDLLDINATHKPANWKFLKYQAHDEAIEAIRFGETMTIKYQKLGMLLALQKEKVRAIKATKGVLPPIQLRRSEGEHIGDQRLPIVTKSEVDDFSHYWVLQNVDVMEGGALKWSSKFYIKNALTGQFLGPGLKFDIHPDPEFYFFFPKPDSFLEDSLLPNGYPLMIKCKGEMVLTPDGKKSNEEALDHLVPITAAENQFESKEIGTSLEILTQDQRESLFELDYVSALESRFFNLTNSLYPKFVEIRDKIESFKKITEATGKKSWEATEELEKRLSTMVAALEDINKIFRETVGDELEAIQRIFAGLKFHTVLIDIAWILHTMFETPIIREVSTDTLIENANKGLICIWNLLNDVALENESSARKIAEYQMYLCELLKYDTLRIGSLLTEVFRLVDPEIKDPKQFYHQWCCRLENLTKKNLQEQVIYMRIIRNLCEIGDTGSLEYQKEITRHLFVTEIAIDLVIFCQHQGQFAVRFGCKANSSVSMDEFQVLNPDLAPFVKEDADGHTILLLSDLSGLEDYVEYVQTALMLYHSISRGRCEMARNFLSERLGITVETSLQISQNLGVNIDIRQAFLFLLEALCITAPPYEPTSDQNTSFSYADIKMLEGKESIRQPLFNPHTEDVYVTECLKMVFDFWMTKAIPAPMVTKELFSQLKFLLSMLRLTLAVVEFQHCTELYALIIQKAIQYLLVGFTESANTSDAHWGTKIIRDAVRGGNSDRRIRLLVNELLAGVLSNLLAIKKSGRRNVIMQVLSKFIIEEKNFRNPLFGTGLLGQEAYQKIVAELKDIVDTERGEKMIFDFIKRIDKTKRNPNLSFNSSLLSQSTLPIEGYVPQADFREIVSNAPPLREVFIRVILEWANFSTALKNKMIDVMNEIFKEKRLFNKFLRTSDVISLGPISVIYNRLRWVKENCELSSMIIRAKFECMTSGQSKSLMQIVHTLEYLINFCHPRNGSNEFVLGKTQNIMRQLGLNKDVMMLWTLVQHLDRMGKGRDTPSLRLKGALITFLLYYIKGNPSNVKSLAKMLAPTYYIMSVVQYPALLRLVNDYNHLQIRDVNRLVVYILDVVQQSDKELNYMTFLEKLMVDRSGMLKRNIQNIASTLLSEKVASAIDIAKERPLYLAALVESLALSAEDNTPVITQCRHLISFSHLTNLMLNETHPMVLSALCYFLFTVYIKKLPAKDAKGLKMLEKIEDIAKVVEHVLKYAIEGMKQPTQVLKFAKDGSYSLVYFTQNPAYTDININVPNMSPELLTWMFLCKELDGRMTGVLKYIPDILECVELDIGMQPVLKGFYDAMAECKGKVKAMQQQTTHLLCFDPLISFFDRAGQRLKKCAEKIQVELEDPLIEFECPIDEAILTELRDTAAASIPFIPDPASGGEIAVDERMASVVKIGYQQFTKMFSLDNEDSYINAIVGLIDDRLTKGLELTKHEVKDLIISLGGKIRRLQKLFTSSKQRVQLFRIIEGIVPEEDLAEFKIQLNPLFVETDVIGTALGAILKHECHEEVIAALSFLHKLFLLQDPQFMEDFRIKINEDSWAYPLFIKIQGELSRAKGFVMDLVSREKTRKEMNALSSLIATVSKAKGKEEAGTKQNQILIRMLDFIQICCDNCNEPFQKFFKTQENTEGKADVDLVTAVATFLIDIRFARDYLFLEPTIFAILNAALRAMVDFVTGPCELNQKLLGNNVRIFLMINTLIGFCQGKAEKEKIEVHRNCIKFLCTLLEGHPDVSVPETMCKFLNLSMIRQGCEDVYTNFVVGHEEELSLESDSLSKEHKDVVVNSIQQAILLKKMKDIGVIHDELIKFEASVDDPTYSYGFYTKYTGYVEITRNDQLENHLYVIPWKCKYLTPSTRHTVLMDVNRASHQEKIKGFLGHVTLCRMEMEHQQMLYNSKTLKSFSIRWALFGKVSFYIALSINIVLLCSIQKSDYSDLTDNIVAFTIVAVLGVMQIIAYMSAFFFQLLEYYPQALAKAIPQPQEFEIDKFPKIEDSDSHVMRSLHASFSSNERKDYRTELQEKIKETLFNGELYYTYMYFLLSIIAVYDPVFYAPLLLDVIKQTPELINVLNSVTQNFRQLILTMWLEVILIYLFAIISFVAFQSLYIIDNNLYCGDLWNCFFSTLQMGIRNGGDFMDLPAVDQYWTRMLYDMMFWLINIIILMNVIFGIIIDTFAELRDERTQVLEDIQNCCYICGSERSQIELKGSGWSYHFMREHSMFAYLSFLIYIGEKKVYNCSGLEKHCKECFDRLNTSFMPAETSILMEGGNEQEIKTGDDD